MSDALLYLPLALALACFTACAGNNATETTDANPSSDTAAEVSLPTTPQYVHIVDAPTDDSSVPCVSTKSPGADIDAIRIFDDPSLSSIKATLTQCQWLETGTRCDENLYDDASQAEGKPNGSPFDGFVSLNSGSIVCQWSSGQVPALGNVLQAVEMSSGPDREPYQIRLCNDASATTCGAFQNSTTPTSNFPAGSLLF